MALSFANAVKNSKFLSSVMKPLSTVYSSAAGYRQIGLRYDDLIAEESETVQEALRRLEAQDPKESYDRAFRLRRAQQCSLAHHILPKNEWTKPEDDIRYLQPIVDEVTAEEAERVAFNNAKLTPRH